MKKDTFLTEVQQKIKKKASFYFLLSCIILMGANSLVFSPLYVIVSTDVLFSEGILPTVMYFLISLTTTLTYAVCFSLIILTTVLLSASHSSRQLITFGISLVVREVLDIVMTLIIYQYIDSVDIFSSVTQIVLDGILICGVMLISSACAKRFYIAREIRKDADASELSEFYGLLPIDKTISRSNPLLCSALIVAIILSAINLISRTILIITQLSYTSYPSYDIFSIIGSYLSDILTGLIFYVVAWFILNGFYKNHISKE